MNRLELLVEIAKASVRVSMRGYDGLVLGTNTGSLVVGAFSAIRDARTRLAHEQVDLPMPSAWSGDV
jgi:hypothetical protein